MSDAPDRIACPKCGCTHIPVQRTKTTERFTVRYRRCRNCGRSIQTRERIIPDQGSGSISGTKVDEPTDFLTREA